MNTEVLLQRIESLEARLARIEPAVLQVDKMDRIKKRVADYFKISLREIHGVRRPNRIAHPRMIAMMLCQEAGYKTTEIGESFGRDHSTVTHASRTISRLMDTDANLRESVESLRAACEIL